MRGLDKQIDLETHKVEFIILKVEKVEVFRRSTTFILS
jgi:hypothetical protein